MKKVKNPLRKRVIKELFGDWRKYLVIAVFLIVMIGFISGMFVANNSMLTSAEKKITEYNLEDGSFEVSEVLDEETIRALESGEKADIRQYFLDKGRSEADKEVEKAVAEELPDEIDKTVREGIEDNLRAEITKNVEAETETYKAMGMEVPDSEKKAMIDKLVDENLETTIDEYYDEAYKEAYDSFIDSKEYQDILDEAKEEAYKEVEEKVDEEYNKVKDKYDLENPDYKPTPIKIYENFYKDASEESGGNTDSEKRTGKIRVFTDRTDIDLYSIHEGEMPKTDSEIAIDRMHAANVGIKVGDKITVSGKEYTVTALIALVNYSTLYEKPTDSMFDAIYFDVAMVTKEGWDRIDQNIHYNYAWLYNDKPADDIEEKDLSENVMAALISQAAVKEIDIENFLPNYANEAIHFATNDMGRDKVLAGIMLYIIVAVLAFVFAITISNTITKEASVIGTLRASGYTRAELLRHYMTMPVLVTLIAAIIGNVLGYTVFKQVVINMYYNSYSLPTYETYWTSDAFIKTTVVPVILMFIINLFVITRMLKFSPLKFLRHDLKLKKRKKAMRLPKWKFLTRFRTRILLQNIPNYIVLIVGITFVMLMMAMCVGFPESLDKYQDKVKDLMFAKHQTILVDCEDEDGNPIETADQSAEKIAMRSLEYQGKNFKETIAVYGIEESSKYIKNLPNLEGNNVYISSTFAEKYRLSIGDTFKLDEKYEKQDYEFKVAGIYDYAGSLTVFMPIDNYRDIFGEDSNYFTGYMSDEALSDIDDEYIATSITEDDMLKVTRQLDHSIGAYMNYFQYVCVILSAVLIYLLTKIIIEKNENSISMVKILGYENREISSLYMMSTTLVVVFACGIGIVASYFGMAAVFREYIMSMEGWFDFVISPLGFVKMFVFVFAAYFIIMLLDYRRIKKIPMDMALKNAE